MPPNPSPSLLDSHDDRILRVEEKVEGLREGQARQTVMMDQLSESARHVQQTLDTKIVPALEGAATKQREAFEAAATKQREAFEVVDRRLKVLEDHHVQALATRNKVRGAVWAVLAAALGAIGTAFGGDFSRWLKAMLG